MKKLAGVYLALALLLPVCSAANGLSVDAAYVPEPAPAAAAAAYFVVRNDGDESIAIVGAVGSDGSPLPLHRSSIAGEVARMTLVERISIAPGQSLSFEPGGLHVMIRDAVLESGDVFHFFLVLEEGIRVPIAARVRDRVGTTAHVHEHSSQRGDPE